MLWVPGLYAGLPAAGKLTEVWAPSEAAAGEPVSFYAQWSTRAALDGRIQTRKILLTK